jgi:hypothetical protein
VKRVLIAVGAVFAIAVLALVAVGVFGQARRAHRVAVRREAAERFAAAHPLEMAAASINSARRAGQVTHFALVPQSMPPGIVWMGATDPLADDGVTDIYSYGTMKVAVNFTAVPGQHPCAEQPCVRDTDLTVETSDAPSLRHVAVWLMGTPSPDAAEVKRFWVKTAWVPTAKAKWFKDLALQGEVYGSTPAAPVGPGW